MSVTTIPLLEDMQGAWRGFQIELVGEPEPIRMEDVYPFLSVNDLKRAIWVQQKGDPRWAPEHVFVGVRVAEGIRSIEFHWSFGELPDPLHREPHPELIDEAGNRKPIAPTMTGSIILEQLMSPTDRLTVLSLASLSPDQPDQLTGALFGGYYQLYFPGLTAPGQVLDARVSTKELSESYLSVERYISDRMRRIHVVQRALAKKVAGESVTMESLSHMRWTFGGPRGSLERIFYGLQASEIVPYIRLFAVDRAPLLKLGLQPDGSPIINDERVLAHYLNQAVPSKNIIVAKIPLGSAHTERGAAFTLFLFEDGSCDISIDVPQRGVTYAAAVAADAERNLPGIVRALFPTNTSDPRLCGLNATYKWIHPTNSAPLSSKVIRQRMEALTPFLEPVPVLVGDPALALFQWRAISNYDVEVTKFAYITQMVLRGPKKERMEDYYAELAEKFGVTKDVAKDTFAEWEEKKQQKKSTGALVAIQGAHPEYTLDIHNIESAEELQRIVSVVGVLLGADLTIAPPAPSVKAAEAAVALADAEMDALSGDEGEIDPAMLALMAEMGMGQEEEPEPEPEPTPAEPAESLELPAPEADTDANCQGTRWAAGDEALKMTADYYMAKLRKEDKVLFAYKQDSAGRSKSYSKSCQRGDDRQPNIMTKIQYARIKRCYEGRIRFVDLPPKSKNDLPDFPEWDPKKPPPDEYYLTDPTTGLPMWTVFGYENKTDPRTGYRYLMCAELWCERDNLPLLRAEYEGTVGRGFSKPPNTCPFCGGQPIPSERLATPKWGESVIVRLAKESTAKLHQFIGTIMRNKHPAGYLLPCCDTTPRFLVSYIRDTKKGLSEKEEDVAEPPPEMDVPAIGVKTDYQKIFSTMETQYILSNDKALDAGKIGVLPPALDAFFGQNGQRSLVTRGIRQTFGENTHLFVHVGVDNRAREKGLNLFAGLAPLLGYESAEECRDHIIGKRMVRAFESANYGTLVHEFAAKAKLTDAEVNRSIQTFASEYGYNLGDNRPHVVRLYKAWSAFITYLSDDTQPKQLRHLEHLLANPGTLEHKGLLLVVLEQNESLKVVCPSFGIPPASIFGDVPVAFIWHDIRDESWEPLVLYNGTKDAVLYFGEKSADLASVPEKMREGLKNWIRDWRSSGCGRPPPPHVWTPDRDTTGLPRLNQLRSYDIKALVRDRSNRVAGVLVGEQRLFIPCLDDGVLLDQVPRVFEATSIPPVPLNVYLDFYKSLTVYPMLKPVKLLAKLENSSSIIGFRTAIGSDVPVSPSPPVGMDIDQIDAFPWERDSIIRIQGVVQPKEESTASVEEQLAEAFQYLRITLSNWLLRDERGPAMRSALKALIASDLPLYEARKRMDILLEPLLREWLSVEEGERKALALLRRDCLQLPQEECGKGCSWVPDRDRCLIHAPVGQGSDPVRIFTARLGDELLRYSSRRNEILENTVQIIRTPRGVVRVGNELFAATKDKESAKVILERLGFTGRVADTFPEEMIGPGSEELQEPAPVDIQDWLALGFTIPDRGDKRFVLAQGTGSSIEKIEKSIQKKRVDLGLPGDAARGFQWSIQDFYVLAWLYSTDILFVHQEKDIKVDHWIPNPKKANSTKMIFWGDQQYLITKDKAFRFQIQDLPERMQKALDNASPDREDTIRGMVDIDSASSESEVVAVPEAEAEAEAEAPVAESPVAAESVEAPVAEAPVVEAPVAPVDVEAPVAPVAEAHVDVEAPVAPVVEAPVEVEAPVAPVSETPMTMGSPEAPMNVGSPDTPMNVGSHDSVEAPMTMGSPEAPMNVGSPESVEAPMTMGSPEAPMNVVSPEAPEAPEAPMNMGAPMTSEPQELPIEWAAVGLSVPEGTQTEAFETSTKKPISYWLKFVQQARKNLQLGDPNGPITWSKQDLYIIATIKTSDVVLVHHEPSGTVKIDMWILSKDFTHTSPEPQQRNYMVFWNNNLVNNGKKYMLRYDELPEDLRDAMELTVPEVIL